MYTLAVRRDFIAQHALIGGDWGAENLCHSHHYVLEQLGEVVSRYRDHFLNDFPEFAHINPSLEHFARILCTTLSAAITAPNIQTMRVVLWENEIAWASYRVER